MNFKRDLAILAVLIVVVLAGGLYFGGFRTPVLAGLKLGQAGTYSGVVIKPVALVEDSRCAEGVQCIWAGTLKVQTEIKSGLGTAVQTLELGKPITTEAEEVTLVSVAPYPKSGETIAPSSYRFIYNVNKRAPATSTGKCYVGGCSAQLCTDEPGAISTCEYTAAYACYKTAKCERQVSGQCGWTETSELRMCLNAAVNQY